jgi:hypothetical protein
MVEIRREDLEKLSDKNLQRVEDTIDEIQLARIIGSVKDAVKSGGSAFLSSSTLVEAYRKWRRK